MRRFIAVSIALVSALALLALPACDSRKTAKKPAAIAPPPTFTGPEFLHGSIGSLATLRGYHPLYVSSFGVVANLPGTGSSDVPAFLRQRLLNEARLKGWGNANLEIAAGVSPAAFLASPNTAVVKVEGLIPPGAVKGTTFDVLVTALPQTQTTSLEDGVLYTTELGVGGTLPGVGFAREQAKASGPTYLNPFDDQTPEEKRYELRRSVVVLSGGRVSIDRKLELILNQPSWVRSRMIADRINERFPKAPSDRSHTAVAKTDMIIQLNVPARFGPEPQLLLDLISHLYLQRAPNFEVEQARRLADVLLANPSYASDVVLAWRSLGKTAVPVISAFYTHENTTMQLAALEAGAGLGDQATARHLAALAQHADAGVRHQVARVLSNLPRSMAGARVLHELLDDNVTAVRIAAYETMAAIGDPEVQRVMMADRQQLKFVLDLLPSEKPLIYITQSRWPRVVIFGKNTGFEMPLSTSLWGGRLRLKADSSDGPATVFYQSLGKTEGKVQTIAPTVANFIFLLSQSPSVDSPAPGYNLSYSKVVNAIHEMCKQRIISADIELQVSPLAAAIAQMSAEPMEGVTRPETSDQAPTTGEGPAGSAPAQDLTPVFPVQ